MWRKHSRDAYEYYNVIETSGYENLNLIICVSCDITCCTLNTDQPFGILLTVVGWITFRGNINTKNRCCSIKSIQSAGKVGLPVRCVYLIYFRVPKNSIKLIMNVNEVMCILWGTNSSPSFDNSFQRNWKSRGTSRRFAMLIKNFLDFYSLHLLSNWTISGLGVLPIAKEVGCRY